MSSGSPRNAYTWIISKLARERSPAAGGSGTNGTALALAKGGPPGEDARPLVPARPRDSPVRRGRAFFLLPVERAHSRHAKSGHVARSRLLRPGHGRSYVPDVLRVPASPFDAGELVS